MTTGSELFVDLLDATIRSSRNYHRLDHCSHVDQSEPKRVFRFKEETITDLLIGELAGKAYDVSVACPVCGDHSCVDWDGDPVRAISGFRIRALTKHEEGGNRRTAKVGVHADFILAVRRQDPGSDKHLAAAKELRIMVQAKRVDPTRLTFSPHRAQYNKLVEAAKTCGAVPYYALYVQQSNPHQRTPTACPRAQSAADRSIVLAAAHMPNAADALPGRQLAAILNHARPLRCMVGCDCSDPGGNLSKQPGPGTVWDAVLHFVARDFPDYRPASPDDRLPSNVPKVRANLSEYKPVVDNTISHHQTRSTSRNFTMDEDEVLLIRLGAMRRSPTPDRRFIGYDRDMSEYDLLDAARMYWRLEGRRAQRVRYLIISANRQVLGACEVVPDGLTFVEGADGLRRVAFAVTELTDSDLKRRLLAMGARRLDRLRPGARNPCIYLRHDAAD